MFRAKTNKDRLQEIIENFISIDITHKGKDRCTEIIITDENQERKTKLHQVFQEVYPRLNWNGPNIVIPWGELSDDSLNTVALRLAGEAVRVNLNLDKVRELVSKGFEIVQHSAGKNCIPIVGSTGAGKSTLANYLIGCKVLRSKDKSGTVFAEVKRNSGSQIVHGGSSGTLFPEVIESAQMDISFYDCPGFDDTRGPEEQISNAINTKFAIDSANCIPAVIVVIELNAIKAQRGELLKTLISRLSRFIDKPKTIADSLIFVISKSSPQDTTVSSIKDTIRDYYDTDLAICANSSTSQLYLQEAKDRLCLWELLLESKKIIIADVFDKGDSRREILTHLQLNTNIPKTLFDMGLKDGVRAQFNTLMYSFAEEGLLTLEKLKNRQDELIRKGEAISAWKTNKVNSSGGSISKETLKGLISSNNIKIAGLQLKERELLGKRQAILNKLTILNSDEEEIIYREISCERPWFDFSGETQAEIIYEGAPFHQLRLLEEIGGELKILENNPQEGRYRAVFKPSYFSINWPLSEEKGSKEKRLQSYAKLAFIVKKKDKEDIKKLMAIQNLELNELNNNLLEYQTLLKDFEKRTNQLKKELERQEQGSSDEDETPNSLGKEEFEPNGQNLSKELIECERMLKTEKNKMEDPNKVKLFEMMRKIANIVNFNSPLVKEFAKAYTLYLTQAVTFVLPEDVIKNKFPSIKIDQNVSIDLIIYDFKEKEPKRVPLDRQDITGGKVVWNAPVELMRRDQSYKYKYVISVGSQHYNFPDNYLEYYVSEYEGYNELITPNTIPDNAPDAIKGKSLINMQNEDLIKFFQSHGVNTIDKSGRALLHYAAKYDTNGKITRKLLAQEVALVNIGNKTQRTPLHIACMHNNEKALDALLKVKIIEINRPDDNGDTPLHVATLKNHVSIVGKLQKRGANLSAVNNKGHTPLHIAAIKGHSEIFELLLKFSSSLYFAVDAQENTAFHLAAQHGKLNILKVLVKFYKEKGSVFSKADEIRHNEILFHQNDGGDTFIHTAVRCNQLDIVDWVTKEKLFNSLELFNRSGDTLLHVASALGHIQIVKLLLELGARFDSVNAGGLSALEVAQKSAKSYASKALNPYEEITKAIYKHKFDQFANLLVGKFKKTRDKEDVLNALQKNTRFIKFIIDNEWTYVISMFNQLEADLKAQAKNTKKDRPEVRITNLSERINQFLDNLYQENLTFERGINNLASLEIYLGQDLVRTEGENEFIDALQDTLSKYYYISVGLLQELVRRKETAWDDRAKQLKEAAPMAKDAVDLLFKTAGTDAPFLKNISSVIGVPVDTLAKGVEFVASNGIKLLLQGISYIIGGTLDNNAQVRATNIVNAMKRPLSDMQMDSKKVSIVVEGFNLRFRDQIRALPKGAPTILATCISQRIIKFVGDGSQRYKGDSRWYIVRKAKQLIKSVTRDYDPGNEISFPDLCLLALKEENSIGWGPEFKLMELNDETLYAGGIIDSTGVKILKEVKDTSNKSHKNFNYYSHANRKPEVYGFQTISQFELDKLIESYGFLQCDYVDPFAKKSGIFNKFKNLMKKSTSIELPSPIASNIPGNSNSKRGENNTPPDSPRLRKDVLPQFSAIVGANQSNINGENTTTILPTISAKTDSGIKVKRKTSVS